MNLFSLLTERRQEILERCREKMNEVMGSRSSTQSLDEGLPILYEELVEVLRISLTDTSPEARHRFVTDTVKVSGSRKHAQESYRLGYTVSQLVHGYGCICQAITEFADEVDSPIRSTEFSQLNLCLDVAIAQAVSEFGELSLESAGKAESLRLGLLVHELRNYLSNAMMAHEMISRGGVGAAGATSLVLANAHQHMKYIVDRAMVEVRLKAEPIVERSRLQVFSLLSEVESTALAEANAKRLSLEVIVDPTIEIVADRHLMASAISNLVQNAIKFTKPVCSIWIRGFLEGNEAVIEVEDRCGGLPQGKTEELFAPYVLGVESPGLGLGLSIARRAIELNGGALSVRNLPGTGCVFTARMPAYRHVETPILAEA